MLKSISNYIALDNDLYILEVIDDLIVTNDNYEGLQFFDSRLLKRQILSIFPDLVIYQTYPSYKNGHMIFLDCPENNCFILCNLKSGDCIVLPHTFNPLTLYYWVPDMLIFRSDQNEFFFLDTTKKSFVTLSPTAVENMAPSFFHLWNLTQNLKLISVNMQQRQIFFQESDDIIGGIKYDSKEKWNIKDAPEGIVDCVYANNTVFMITEKALYASHNGSAPRLIENNPNINYLKIRNYRGKLLLLSCDSRQQRISMLTMYSLTYSEAHTNE